MHYQCLIVDDEVELAESTAEYFNLFGVSTAYVTGYEACLDFLEKNTMELILLDINLENQSGFELCRRLRQSLSIPILFISARTSDDDVLIALHIGGDDYIKKPYSLSVLLAKVQAVLRRLGSTEPGRNMTGSCESDRNAAGSCGNGRDAAGSCESDRNAAGNCGNGRNSAGSQEIVTELEAPSGWRQGTPGIFRDEVSGRVYINGREVKLKAMEYRLLSYLMNNKGRILSKEELFDQVWQDKFTADGTLNVHIRRLREKLEDNPNEPVHIVTVWGRGYCYED